MKQKPARATAVDFLDSHNTEDQPSPSKPSTSRALAPLKSDRSKPSRGSKGSVLETKTILKSSKKVVEPTTGDVPAKEKHVKFAVKPSDSKTKRNKALGMAGKKVRSGGGKGASAKDGVLNKKVAVK